MVLGKMLPVKMPLPPLENCHRKIAPRKFSPEKLPTMKFFLWFFTYLYFLFLWEFSSIRKIYFHYFFCYKFVYSICLQFAFYIFVFQAWDIMFIIHICMTNDAEHPYLATRFFNTYKHHHTETLHIFTVCVRVYHLQYWS